MTNRTQPAQEPFDVVVVGARAAGAATAMLLARAGLRVLVLDRGRYGTDTLSTHALLRAGVMQLSRWGLLDQVADSGAPAVRRTTFSYGDKRIDVPIKPCDGFDALYAPRRTALDRILVDAARAAGAEVRFGTSVTGLTRSDVGRVTGVVGHDDTGARFTIRARMTVGADGMSSRVARLVSAPVERSATHAAAAIYGYWEGRSDGYELFYRPGVTGGVFPTNDNQSCVFVCLPPARLHARGSAGTGALYRNLLDEVAPGWVEAGAGRSPTERLRVFTGRAGYLRRAGGPGWALVGDAGYFKDPITSHGLTDALRDAELLTRALLAGAHGEIPEPLALERYQATRDRLSAGVFATTDAIASFAWDLDEIKRLLKELSVAMSDEVRSVELLDAVVAA